MIVVYYLLSKDVFTLPVRLMELNALIMSQKFEVEEKEASVVKRTSSKTHQKIDETR